MDGLELKEQVQDVEDPNQGCFSRLSRGKTGTKTDEPGVLVNSLTPKSVLAATENSSSEGFWLVKHNHTNIPTMMEPFSPPVAWF
jgi:hypothetical protein